MLHETIRRLIRILKEEDVDEIEVRRFWTSVRVCRRRGPAPGRSRDDRARPAAREVDEGGRSPEPATVIDAITAQVDASGDESAGRSGLSEIISPMVGTFYRAANPEEEPFVHEGKAVSVGETLCIIEAMKLMNEIEAESDCIIRKILVEDSQPVEYGQPLFLIESA